MELGKRGKFRQEITHRAESKKRLDVADPKTLDKCFDVVLSVNCSYKEDAVEGWQFWPTTNRKYAV